MPRRILLAALCLIAADVASAAVPRFKEVVIDPHIGNVCYAVTKTDVNGDGKLDIVAASENRVQWYQNPGWQKHVILEDQTERDNVCIAPHDIDGDGRIDFALGAGWTKIGTIQWISRGKSPDEKWSVHRIGIEPWTHRMSFADVLGSGKPQLVISPLNRTTGEGVRLMALSPPKNPKTDRWPETVLDASLNRMHNHWNLDFERDGSIDTLVAAEEGVFLIRRKGDEWTKTKLGTGMPADDPRQRGAGEIKTGRLTNGKMFIATIEPMHGTSVVVYTEPKSGESLWTRHVLDDTLKQGHAIWPADLDGDGGDELVVGHREAGSGTPKGPGLYVYQAENADGTKWSKHVIDDGGVAVEDAFAVDLTGDGKPDLVAGGRATHNVKLYVNLGE